MALSDVKKNVKRYMIRALGNTVFHDVLIAPGEILKRIDFFLRGPIVFTGGSTSGSSVGPNPGGIINRLIVRCTKTPMGFYADGTIRNLTPRSLLRREIFDYGKAAVQTAIAGAATTYTLDQAFSLPFAFPNLKKPIDSALRTDHFTQVQVEIQTIAAITSMLTGNDRTVDASGLYIEVVEDRVVDPNFIPRCQTFETDFDFLIPGANQRTNIQQYLSPNEAYLDMLFQMESSQVLVDTILNKATIRENGSDTYVKLNSDIAYANLREITDAATAQTGIRRLNFCDGMLTKAIANVDAELDLSDPSAGNDHLIVDSRRVLASAAAAAAIKAQVAARRGK